MGSVVRTDKEREGAEVVHGAEACYKHSIELIQELGIPKGVLPLKNMVECGRVRDTGFVWMKQSAPSKHYFKGTKTLVSYATEVTAYVEKHRMVKITGIKSRQLLLWVPLVEMSIEDPASNKIYFKTSLGIGRSYPFSAFEEEGEESSEQQLQVEENANL